jgi:hypothetical protein
VIYVEGGIGMDASYEDKIYSQIEKNLSNNIDEKYYVPTEMVDRYPYIDKTNNNVNQRQEDSIYFDKANIYNENPNNQVGQARLSRAEYIRQAREACLRQLNAYDTSGRISDYIFREDDTANSVYGKKKKDKVSKLFNQGRDEENMEKELLSYKSLVIRTVCALVIFFSLFIIDKIKFELGNFTYETIRHYVTGFNQMDIIEEIIVSWLK